MWGAAPQLAIEASQIGHHALGIDFASEMVEIAKRNNNEIGGSAEFEAASVFDYEPCGCFDMVSAMGFIEYISLGELEQFLLSANSWLSESGAISIGSRNRF